MPEAKPDQASDVMQLAHCSDIHLLSMEGVKWLHFANKRWIGGLNLLTNRAKHYQNYVFDAMVADINASDIDHVLCTGDVTNLALEPEFRFARERFAELALGSDQVTVIPGNHDAYIAEGVTHFANIFADYHRPDESWKFAQDGLWPLVRVRGPVAIIGLSTSQQTPWFTAYGRLDRVQLDRLRDILASERLAGKLRLVAIHHPPTGQAARNRVRGLHGWREFAEVIAEVGAELILHGHEHRDLRHELPGPENTRIPVLGIQSGTYCADNPDRTARYRVFDISRAPLGTDTRPRVMAQRMRMWDAASKRFIADRGQVASNEAASHIQTDSASA